MSGHCFDFANLKLPDYRLVLDRSAVANGVTLGFSPSTVALAVLFCAPWAHLPGGYEIYAVQLSRRLLALLIGESVADHIYDVAVIVFRGHVARIARCSDFSPLAPADFFAAGESQGL